MAAFSGVFLGGVCATAEVAPDSIPLELADGIASCVSQVVASGALMEWGPGLKAAGQGVCSKCTDGGL